MDTLNVCISSSNDFLEDYFAMQSTKTGTSDHILSKLVQPDLDMKSMHSVISSKNPFKEDMASLFKEYKSMYNYWLFQMSHGFNILLYGLGSKRDVLEDFRKTHLLKSCHVVVNGFFPDVTIKGILTQFSSEILGHSGTFKSHLEHALFIQKTLETKKNREMVSKTRFRHPFQEIFLVVHNIDGPSLRSDNAQAPLSILAQCPAIHVLASIDHINAPLIWDQKKLSRYNWLWHDITTYEAYKEECSYMDSIMVQQSGSLELSSLIHVTRSLPSNSCNIFKLLAQYQLENKDDGAYIGMSFHDCFVKCKEKFFASNDMTFKQHLVEFRDHKLVKSRYGPDGSEYLYIPVNQGILSQFMENDSEE